MIYLFNSSYRPLYTTNILNTLFLPFGSTNEYRYSIRGEKIHISPDKYPEFINKTAGDEVVIVFIDRFAADGYQYHPIRRGKLLSCEERSNRLFFNVKLEDFICSNNVDEFNDIFRNNLDIHGIPKLTDNDLYNVNDGYYAIESDSMFVDESQYSSGDSAWISIVERLSSTKAFKATENTQYIFLKSNLRNVDDDKLIDSNLRDNTSQYDLTLGKDYELMMTYYFPEQRNNREAIAKVDIDFGMNLTSAGSNSLDINSLSNSLNIKFATKQHVENNQNGIKFTYSSAEGDVQTIGPDKDLLIRLKQPNSFWLYMFIAFILFSICSVILSTDFSNITPLSFKGLLDATWAKIIFGFIQALVLFWILKLSGQKFL